MLFSDIEYVVLRAVRKFFFTDAVLMRIGRFIPHYGANLGMGDPFPIARKWVDALGGPDAIAEKRVLELGSGATNSSAYALAALGARHVIALEPFRAFEAEPDATALQSVAASAGVDAETIARKVIRATALSEIPDGEADVIVSHSVLEHVLEPEALLAGLDRVLAPGGTMCHAVDFRDHFFKYPFHFLTFRKRTWDRWLNPGDLPRWRLSDYERMLDAAGYDVTVAEKQTDEDQFARVKARLSLDFDPADPTLAITLATVLASRHTAPRQTQPHSPAP